MLGVNAAQNNQVLIGDGATANGSEEVVIGTNAKHVLPAVSADTLFPGTPGDADDPAGIPDADYQARMGHSVVIGDSASGNSNGETVLGANASANDPANANGAAGAVAVGFNAASSAADAVAVGNGAQATGASSISVGSGNVVSGAQSGAFGDPNSITGTGSFAVGNDNTIAANNSFVLGNSVNIPAGMDGDVALGNASTVAAPVPTAGTTILGTAYTFAGGAPTSVVSVGAAGAERQVTNVAAGQLSGTSTDAVNGSQLYATNQALEKINLTKGSGFTLSAEGGTPVDVNPATNVDVSGGSSKNITASVSQPAGGGTELTIDTNPNLTATSVTTGNTVLNDAGVSITGGTNGTVSLANTGLNNGGNQITNVAAGTSSSAAVNLSQLQAQETHYYSVNANGVAQGANYANNGATGLLALAAGYAASATASDAVAVGNSSIASGTSSTAIGVASKATNNAAVAVGESATASGNAGVAVGNLTNAVGDGSFAAGLNAAANSNSDVAIGSSAVAGTVGSTAAGSGTDIAIGSVAAATGGGSIAEGTSATANATRALALGYETNVGGASSFGVGANDSVTGTSSGAIGSGNTVASDDAFALGNNINIAAGFNGSVAIGDGSAVAAPVPTAGATILGTAYTFAGATPTSVVSVGAPGSERQVTNVAAGQLTAASTDAVNGSQLYATNEAVNKANQLAGEGFNLSANGGTPVNIAPGATVDVSEGPSKNIVVSQNPKNGNLTIDTSPNLTATSVTTGNTVLNTSGVAITGGANGPVAITSAGLNNGGNKITDVAAGTANTDAVNVGQLNTAVQGVATHYYSVNDAGSQEPNYNNHGATGVDALAAGVDASAKGAGGVAVGMGAQASMANSVALGEGAQTNVGPLSNYTAYGLTAVQNSAGEVNIGDYLLTGKIHDRQITGVAAGSAPDDAVNVAQLEGAVANNPADKLAVKYDADANGNATNTVTLIGSGTGQVGITNLAPGAVTSTSTDAINGSQLFHWTQDTTNIISNQSLYNDIKNLFGNSGDFVVNDTDNLGKPTATGDNTAAGGAGATAAGANSTAVGNGAQAQGTNSVAIGADSVATRDNVVSVGSPGHERQITNVAAGTQQTDAVNVAQLQASQAGTVKYDVNNNGTINYKSVTLGGPNGSSGPTVIHNVAPGVADTDAVNVQQLNGVQNWAQQYADSKFNMAQNEINRLGNRAYAGIAAAMAIAGLPQAYSPGHNMASVAASTFNGQSALAVGVSTISDNGRWVYKLSGTDDTRGDAGVTIGAGIQW